MLIRRRSLLTGKIHEREINVDEITLCKWLRGEGSIQLLMPHLSNEDREFLISGTTEEEWKNAMTEPDEPWSFLQ